MQSENLTALEYHEGKWSVYQYNEVSLEAPEEQQAEEKEWTNKELFSLLLKEFRLAV